MKKIYVSSQFFGYGPTSNLFSILKSLKSKSSLFEIYGIKNEVMEFFASKNPGIIDQWSGEIDYSEVDILMSSFDPFYIFEAWLNDIPTIFYCNLFWYWNVFDKKNKMILHKENFYRLKAKNKLEARALFRKILSENPHEAIFLGYMLSTNCFTRNFYDIDNFIDVYKNEMNLSVFDTHIPYQLKNPEKIKKQILIQLAGSRNCIVTKKENIFYMDLCLKLAKYIADIYPNFEIIICANPLLLTQVNLLKSSFPGNVKITPSFSQEENMFMIEDSFALFASPGLETIYEGIYCRCPIFLLPEQNAGQYSIFQLLNKTGYNPDRFLINEFFPNRNKLSGENDAHAIYEIIKKNILNSKIILDCFFNKAINFVDKMMQKKEKNKYLTMSLNSLILDPKKSPFAEREAISDFIIQHYS